MKKILAAAMAGSLTLAGCAKGPGTYTVDTATTDLIQNATVLARNFCGFLPTAQTLAQIVLALALPAGLPIEQVASSVAHAFCDAIKASPVVAARAGRRAIDPNTGRAIIDYGPTILPNGKVVPIQVYVQ
jgi:hypothetical protein